MNKAEAESIAWEICKLQECYDQNIRVRDGTMFIANQAAELLKNILTEHPKINAAFVELYDPPNDV